MKMVVGVAWARESHFEQLRFPLPTQITRKRIGKREIALRWEGGGRSTEDLFGSGLFTYHRVAHTYKHSCSLVSCDPLIRARFGPTVGHINLQLQQQADASNLAMYTRVYAHIHIHTYELYINTHIHTYTHIFSSYFARRSVHCPLSLSVHPLPG